MVSVPLDCSLSALLLAWRDLNGFCDDLVVLRWWCWPFMLALPPPALNLNGILEASLVSGVGAARSIKMTGAMEKGPWVTLQPRNFWRRWVSVLSLSKAVSDSMVQAFTISQVIFGRVFRMKLLSKAESLAFSSPKRRLPATKRRIHTKRKPFFTSKDQLLPQQPIA